MSFCPVLLSVLAFAAMGFSAGAAEETPLLRFGVMTDTHIGKTARSCARVKQAHELFKAKDCELVVHLGDVAESHSPEGYKAYRKEIDAVYAGGKKPREVFTYAWHDAFSFQGHARAAAVADAPAAFEAMRQLLQAENGHTETVRCKGYDFVVFPQFVGGKDFISWAEYEKRIADACAASPGKPVFVVDHIPPRCLSMTGDSQREAIASRYPQVVYFCGHVHGTLWNERQIRQEKFTAINAGCLQRWGSGTAGHEEERRPSYGVLTVDVYADRLCLRRWDVRDGTEIGADSRWIVPWPFDAATAPWRREVRKALAQVPAFPTNATLDVMAEGKPFGGFRLRCPSAGAAAYKYRIDVLKADKDGKWLSVTWREALGDWWMPERERQKEFQTLFEAPYFEPGEVVRFEIRAQNGYGVWGPSAIRSVPVTVPIRETKGNVVFDSRTSGGRFEILPRKAGPKARAVVPDADGWYGPLGGGEWVLKLPVQLFAGNKGTQFRVSLELETDIPEASPHWNLRLSNAKGPGFGSGRCAVSTGKSGKMRYVLEMKLNDPAKRGASDSYDVYFEHAAAGRLRPGRVKVEKL